MDLTLHICQLYHTNRTWHTYMSAPPVENIKLNLNYNLSTSPNPHVVEATRCAATLEITGSSIISTRYVLPPLSYFIIRRPNILVFPNHGVTSPASLILATE